MSRCDRCHSPLDQGKTCPYCASVGQSKERTDGQKAERSKRSASFDAMSLGLPGWSRQWLGKALTLLSGEAKDALQSRVVAAESFPHWLQQGDEPPRWFADFFAGADRELCTLWMSEGYFEEDPKWFDELEAAGAASVSRTFILHGNINDYHFHPQAGYILIDEFLARSFGDRASFYSLSRGFTGLGAREATQRGASDENLLQRVRADFLELDHYVRGEEALGRVLVIGYLERLFPAGIADMEREFLIETILRWAVDPLIPKNNLIIFTTTNYDGLHPDLKSRLNKIQTLAIPRPDNRQRAKFITAWFYSLQGNTSGQGRPVMPPGRLRFGEEFGENDRSRILTLAQKTAGLNNMGVEDMILRALARHGGRLTSNAVSRHKKTLLAGESAGLVDVIEPRFGFEVVGGLLGVRNRLMQVCRALNHADPIVRRTIPMGILFLGPPGTGKSLVAEALARESKLTFVKLGNFRDMYVGQSERNLSLALQLIRSLAPVVVFVDEIDQNIGRRGNSGESGPEKRLFARLLEFMSDSEMRGQVLWIGASNEPKNLDDAFKRAGRFDLKLPFFLPELPERRSILDIKINGGRGAIPNHIGDEELARIAAQTDGFSGAELEVLVNEGLRLAVGDERPQGVVLETRHLDEVLRRYDPSDSIRKYREMELEIAKDIPDADLLPERVRVEMKRRSQ